MKYYVNENCIGCGLCESVCPEVFSLSDDGVAVAISEDVPDILPYFSDHHYAPYQTLQFCFG